MRSFKKSISKTGTVATTGYVHVHEHVNVHEYGHESWPGNIFQAFFVSVSLAVFVDVLVHVDVTGFSLGRGYADLGGRLRCSS
jgi:hypothetical protein